MNEKKEFHQTVTFWLLFVMTIFFVISFFCNLIALFNLEIDTRANILSNTLETNSIMYLEEGILILASVFALVAFFLSLIAYITSFSAVRDKIVSKSVNRVILLIFICSLLYLIFQSVILATRNI